MEAARKTRYSPALVGTYSLGGGGRQTGTNQIRNRVPSRVQAQEDEFSAGDWNQVRAEWGQLVGGSES